MPRRFTDREVSLIIQHALAPDADVMDAGIGDSGLSLEQIKEVALEVGIDPARIDFAAARFVDPYQSPPNPLVGIPTSVQFETTLPGVEVGRLPRHELLDVARSVMGRQGVDGGADDEITWRARDASGARYVTISPTSSGVRLRVLGNYRDTLLVFFGGVATMVLAISSVVLGELGLGSAASLALGTLLAMSGARFAYRLWRRGEDRRMAALHGRLLSALRSAAVEADVEESGRSLAASSEQGG